MQGARVDYPGSGPLPAPGSYWKRGDAWYGVTPNGLYAGLANHTVTEHDDGAITVAPSIYVNRGMTPEWHGYLERGVWRQV